MNLRPRTVRSYSTTAFVFLLAAFSSLAQQSVSPRQDWTAQQEADYIVHDFHFRSGETMAELRLHYRTLGKAVRDAAGHTTNAVLVMHGTGGSGQGFLVPIFAGVLFGPGQPLDVSRYFVILPDAIGHGKSSKPSDGLRAHFPQYDYDDMVAAQHELIQKGLGVDHLRLVMGTSMGCMHSWVWAETYPSYMDALMPLACLPVQIAGRNRMWRDLIIDGIRNDPQWKNGDYTEQPRGALEMAAAIQLIAGGSPIQMQKSAPARDAADQYLADYQKRYASTFDANDTLYAFSASRNYDPSAGLDKIAIPVMWVNSADDFINPPELGIAEQEIKRLKNGHFVLLPASDQTYGHGTHTHAAVWQSYLQQLLSESAKPHEPLSGSSQR
jgi:homoserine O-acetyltransferase/O-succinyltransferase